MKYFIYFFLSLLLLLFYVCVLFFRFSTFNAGQYQCKMTNLIFELQEKTELMYNVPNWQSSHLDAIGEMQPAGPMYTINCFKGLIHHVHLPHCETDIGTPVGVHFLPW